MTNKKKERRIFRNIWLSEKCRKVKMEDIFTFGEDIRGNRTGIRVKCQFMLWEDNNLSELMYLHTTRSFINPRIIRRSSQFLFTQTTRCETRILRDPRTEVHRDELHYSKKLHGHSFVSFLVEGTCATRSVRATFAASASKKRSFRA